MKMRAVLAASTAMLVCAAGLAACSNDDGGGGDEGEGVTLTFWHNASTGAGKQFWDDTVADFMAENPDVTVKVQSIQNEDLDGKLQTALNSGDAPDVFLQRGGGKMAAMVRAGQLLDLTDLVTDETKGLIPEGSFKANQIEGKTYAMPIAVLPGGIWYSKDLFAAAGITQTPATIEDLDAAVEALKSTGVAPIALGAKDAWPAAHWYYFFALRACSPDTLEATAESMTFDDPCWVEAAENLEALAATEPFNEGFLTTSAQQGAGSSAGLLANHQAAMELMGAWNPGVIGSLTPDEKPLPDLDWFAFPEVPGGEGEPGSILGGVDGYSCSAKAPKQECADFLNFIAKTDVQEAYYKAFNAPPVNTEAQAVITEPYLQSVLEAYNAAPYVSQWLDTVYGQNVGNALNVAVVDLLAGKSDAAGLVESVNAAAAKA
ncbi:ABC transporter substrate-binding protein [Cellulomonas fimi]|uniref:Extracellular solute-binding protein family 1 n=1 Tax=Cellulomonas fimi (strain ATCC 484 / DSM 20113 / JCM 1341 / CCUG 24087 / LMG 16345 / NBRC 15513 / NCIMB 8980 / NCTC 7547 / NRS-133) TaxID=590998 RepID=F4H4N3_CELFA|nr:extracellular solute-binding protein [Cellulomonas fimi]AEE44234.1 extracellular solute-binding protein family 1 [Cellulomonas fimi ATCC 484]NNH05681.1 extracellular solute-binding protein [Cellulomonas fimi]VEH25938.1 Lactose-binding protein precursor [Cellulomonas fimi]